MGHLYDQISSAYADLRSRFPTFPDKIQMGVVLGSAQGGCINFDSGPLVIPYSTIKNFPPARGHQASGHAKRYLIGPVRGINIVVMDGRLHSYEGYQGFELAFPVRLMRFMGIDTLLLTNAAGGLNPDFNVGDFMIIRDHLTLFVPPYANPLTPHDEMFGENPHLPQVPGVLYDADLIEKIRGICEREGIGYRTGVYAFLPGPHFESGSDVRVLRDIFHVDAVGMSTVPEAMSAIQLGIRVAGVAGITNVMKGDSNPTSDAEVKSQAATIGPKVRVLVENLVTELYQ